MRILVTGGAGYIGSHTVVECLARGHDVVVLDNFENSSPVAVVQVARITGREVPTERVDIRDCDGVAAVLLKHRIDAVVHLAALKAVGESCLDPLAYFDTNIVGTVSLLRAMRKAAVNLIVFSSSATVYGEPERSPIPEDAPRMATSPYGRSKIVAEDLIDDVCASHPEFRAAILRYFNPVGAHFSGLIGEDPRGTPGNIMPFLCQVAAGQRAELPIFGDDYPTPDGTGVRDYVHVMDLARAHADALDFVLGKQRNLTVNLGCGHGFSVLELVRAFSESNGVSIPCRRMPRRQGDIGQAFADVTLARQLLGWKAVLGLDRMCMDAWRWQTMNPHGFGV